MVHGKEANQKGFAGWLGHPIVNDWPAGNEKRGKLRNTIGIFMHLVFYSFCVHQPRYGNEGNSISSRAGAEFTFPAALNLVGNYWA